MKSQSTAGVAPNQRKIYFSSKVLDMSQCSCLSIGLVFLKENICINFFLESPLNKANPALLFTGSSPFLIRFLECTVAFYLSVLGN